MLQIKDIRKQYITGDLVQTALDGVSLTLRDNEFVAILGPSGSGKTTLLNVIGGLDRYDSGDLIINGISTRQYTDRDWDSYRNHTIGFIFQSYNLIPHQTVLANVELALTISGISPAERRRRAKEALEAVGLGNQIHKKPNQMSGGQMQRVAIARALVNNPDILLADEPTGALDTATSVQIMDLLKEVARDKLVVMVTHNPELAGEYATRIVRVKDGQITGDTDPYILTEEAPAHHENMGKSAMSFFTALSLSFNNLWTKKARTLLTAFAGSIGIIGIALIMSLSTGFQKYIDKIQEDTLSNYPLSIQQETADMGAALMAMGAAAQEANEIETDGTVVEQQMLSQMFGNVGKNDLASFKAHLDDNYSQVAHTLNAIKYSYGVKPQIYLADTTGDITQVNPAKLFGSLTGSSAMSAYMDSDVFYEMMDNTALLDAQYQVIQGKWPENWDEMVLVLQDPHRIQDYTAYTLGLRDPRELEGMISKVMAGGEPGELDLEPMRWTYEELMDIDFRLVHACDRYRYNAEYQVWEDMSDSHSHMEKLIAEGTPLKIVGIVCPREGVSTTALTQGVAYTSELTRQVIARAEQADIVRRQLENKDKDVFTGNKFGEKGEEKGLNFEEMINIDTDALTAAFGMNVDTDAIMGAVSSYLRNAIGSIQVDTQPAQQDFLTALNQMASNMLYQHIAANAGSDGVARITLADVETVADSYLASGDAAAILAPLVTKYAVEEAVFRQVVRPVLVGLNSCYVASHVAGSDELLPEATEPEPVPTGPAETTEATEPVETEPTEESTPSSEETQPPETTEPTEAPQPVESTQPIETVEGAQAAPPGGTQAAPGERATEAAKPEVEIPGVDIPGVTVPQIEITPQDIGAPISQADVSGAVSSYTSSTVVQGISAAMAGKMMEGEVYSQMMGKLSGLGNVLMSYVGGSFWVDESKFAEAFQFNMSEEELKRLMSAMSNPSQAASFDSNLKSLGYADLEDPTAMSIYFVDFAAKEEFLAFLDGYNGDMEAQGKEDRVIGYADVTGIMMSSVRTIIDSVSYALIAFVAVSLVVSSIMIGIITYISVMERTKEIGVLRAIGASKRNISQVFNAETFIIGLCSGLLGVGITLLLLIPGNQLIQHLTNNPDIVAQLPVVNGVVLVLLSMVLTLIGGLIPAKQAAKKDPVIALRSE